MLLQYVLIALIVFFPLTMLISYLIAVLLGHTYADFPYISDTGTAVPESCVFGQMLNISAVLFALLVYFRFLQVREYIKTFSLPRLTLPNYCSLFTGCLAAFGVSMVANFQETSVLTVHMVGAFIAFLSAGLFMIIETFISFRTSPFCVHKSIVVTRGVIATLHIFAFVMTNVFGAIALQYFDGENERFWKPTDKGWKCHMISTVHEWAMSFFIVAFMVTYGHEFHHTHVHSPQMEMFTDESPLVASAPSESSGLQ